MDTALEIAAFVFVWAMGIWTGWNWCRIQDVRRRLRDFGAADRIRLASGIRNVSPIPRPAPPTWCSCS